MRRCSDTTESVLPYNENRTTNPSIWSKGTYTVKEGSVNHGQGFATRGNSPREHPYHITPLTPVDIEESGGWDRSFIVMTSYNVHRSASADYWEELRALEAELEK